MNNSKLTIINNNNPIKKNLFFYGIVYVWLLCTSIYNANAALSATTINTIKGTPPYLILKINSTEIKQISSLEDLLVFNYPDVSGKKIFIEPSQAIDTIIVPVGMEVNKLQAIVPIDSSENGTTLASLVKQTDHPILQIEDNDGDSLNTATNDAKGSIKAVFKINGKMVNITTSNAKFSDPCNSYELTLTVLPFNKLGENTVEAITQYGNPNTSMNYYNTSTTKSITYKLLPNIHKLCILKPKDMTVYENITSNDIKFPYQNETNKGGYNPDYWKVREGFKAQEVKNIYPKTGFDGALLQLIGSGSTQSVYRCTKSSSSTGTWAYESTKEGAGEGCTIEYKNNTPGTKPIGRITINMSVNDGGSWKVIDSYTLPEPKLWAEGGKSLSYNGDGFFQSEYPAARSCGAPESLNGLTKDNINKAASYFFHRWELTNSPQSRPEEGFSVYNGSYWESNGTVPYATYRKGGKLSRDADGTFMGEWGSVYNYPNSPWTASQYYWASETYSRESQFNVASDGFVTSNNPAGNIVKALAICALR